MFKQIAEFMDPFFSKFQCGFRKSFSTQQCLVVFIEKQKSAVDKGKSLGALLTDLSKAFECFPHELLSRIDSKVARLWIQFECLDTYFKLSIYLKEDNGQKLMKAIVLGNVVKLPFIF